MSSEWFLASPETIELKRIDTTLGLRGAIRYYNDLVAPGIGSVRFVRQLTWSCLAIRHATENKVSSIRLGNAIEAIGLKAYFEKTQGVEYKFRGTRAFKRTSYADENSFKGLSQRKNYVLITYRQNTSRSLPLEGGLGFIEAGSGFETFEISSAGHELLESHQSNYRLDVGKILTDWIKGDKSPSVDVANDRFGPISSEAEKQAILRRLNSDVLPTMPGLRNDAGRRRKIIQIFKSLGHNWGAADFSIGCLNHGHNLVKEDFEKAIDFFDMLRAGQLVLLRIYEILNRNQGYLKITNNGVDKELRGLVKAAEKFLHKPKSMQLESNAEAFGNFIIKHSSQLPQILQEIARRDSRVCLLVEDEIRKGPLYRSDAINPESLEQSIPVSLVNFYLLWSEINGRR